MRPRNPKRPQKTPSRTAGRHTQDRREKGGQTPSTAPVTQAGQCVLLKVVTVTPAGAFMARPGAPDLLVPVSQQLKPMREGASYVVYVTEDPNGRLIGSTKLHNFLDERAKDMAPGEAVDLLIVGETDLGYKAVVNGSHLGLLYRDSVFKPLHPGDRAKGYIKTIREDRKIDLAMRQRNRQAREELTERIVAFLEENGGVSSLTDYSPPDAIYAQYGVSKGDYKKALGALYKQRRITLEKDRVTLVS